MIRIAICDDIRAERISMQNEMTRYLSERNLSDKFEVEVFSDPQVLIRKCTSSRYDLFLLDILMPHITGIETAKELSEMIPEAQFIFVTTTSEFIMDAFSVKALFYLLKPYTSADFDEAMETARKHFFGEDRVNIDVRNANGEIDQLNLGDIVYVAPEGKGVKVILKEKSISYPGYTIETMKNTLNDCVFAEAGGKIFNIENIRHMNDNVVVMRNGEKIGVPKDAFQKLKDAFIEYYER